jgi:hypothetical protein
LDPAATDIAVEGLNNMELGDSTLKVQRASIGMKQAAGVEMGVNAMAMMAGTTSADLEASRVLQLLNMVTPEELMDIEEYEGETPTPPHRNARGLLNCQIEICEDIKEECQKFGKLIDLKVPRPSGGSRQTAGVGKVFILAPFVDAVTDPAYRFLSALKIWSLLRQRSSLWPVASSPTEPWCARISLRYSPAPYRSPTHTNGTRKTTKSMLSKEGKGTGVI